ncbi:hypothetical protein [Polyangium aurulentum]|uniref:hypothetical protein n=1 Tax=Polyangium aurulentum TaxID=2567896 RepID=UPI0010AEB53E|nr:hypothetical protein [Polyangium aurulentum]UQA61099.1 hypothetical protein E8A73_011720 [Polyangium aurulentum]
MNGNGHRTPSNGHTEAQDPRHALRAPDQQFSHGHPHAGGEMSTGEAIGAVVTDAVDLVKELARDGVELGKLEAKRAVGEVKQEAKRVVGEAKLEAKRVVGEAKLEAKRVVGDAAPRVAWGLVALVCGFLALVLGVIAAFILLGILIPSVGWRMLIFAGVFGLVAFFGGLRAAKPKALGIGPKGPGKHDDLTNHRTHVRGLE